MPDLRHPLPLSRRPINSKLMLLLLLLGGLRQAWLSTRRSIPSTLLPAPLPVQAATRTHTHRHRHPHPRMASAVEVKAEELLLLVAWQREECTHRHHRRGYRHRQALSKVSLQLTRPNHSSVRPYTAPLRIALRSLVARWFSCTVLTCVGFVHGRSARDDWAERLVLMSQVRLT